MPSPEHILKDKRRSLGAPPPRGGGGGGGTGRPGLLMRRGFTLVWSGWHADVASREGATRSRFPVPRNADGRPHRGEHGRRAVLLRRQGPHGRAEIIPRDQWSFANCPNGGKGTPSKKHICPPAGFSTDYIYQLIYEAQDPNVQGLGFAATRDVISFLRHDTSDDNLLVITDGHKPIHWTMAFGSSQSAAGSCGTFSTRVSTRTWTAGPCSTG